jgi:hypothetical protein
MLSKKERDDSIPDFKGTVIAIDILVQVIANYLDLGLVLLSKAWLQPTFCAVRFVEGGIQQEVIPIARGNKHKSIFRWVPSAVINGISCKAFNSGGKGIPEPGFHQVIFIII